MAVKWSATVHADAGHTHPTAWGTDNDPGANGYQTIQAAIDDAPDTNGDYGDDHIEIVVLDDAEYTDALDCGTKESIRLSGDDGTYSGAVRRPTIKGAGSGTAVLAYSWGWFTRLLVKDWATAFIGNGADREYRLTDVHTEECPNAVNQIKGQGFGHWNARIDRCRFQESGTSGTLAIVNEASTEVLNSEFHGGGSAIQANSASAKVYHNVCYGQDWTAIIGGASDVRNNVVLDAARSSGKGITGSAHDYNCAYDCDQGNFDTPGANDIESDPLLGDAAGGDLSILAGSPCINAGADVDILEDFLGRSRPSGLGYDIGAYEGPQPRVSSATWTSRTTVDVLLSVEADPATVLVGSFAIAGAGDREAKLTVVGVALSNGDKTATLTVHPEATPGGSYTVTATGARTIESGVYNPASTVGAVSETLAQATLEDPLLPHGALEALSSATASETHSLGGRPTTTLLRAFTASDGALLVESTLGFPTKGTVWVDGERVDFDGLEDGALLQAVPQQTLVAPLPVLGLVVYDPASWSPP